MKKLRIVMLLLMLFPNIVFAYSKQIIVGGENIGINIQSKGILVVGFYKVNGKTIKSSPEIKVGDYIIKVAGTEINSINELTNAIEKNLNEEKIDITILRDGKEINSTLSLLLDKNMYKTGLYVKDSLSGIGTLTYIDPNSKIFGALGHEIIESNSNKKIEVKTGSIFESKVTEIKKSSDGAPGEKKAKLNNAQIYGEISKNTRYGLFGDYKKTLPNKNLIEVAEKEEVKVGEAKILTTLSDNQIKEYTINITKINEYNKIKNIYFEVTDESLLSETGGIVQGMSGSPIIQNNKIIGAVTHVIVDNVKTGYGIFITTMLEEGEN